MLTVGRLGRYMARANFSVVSFNGSTILRAVAAPNSIPFTATAAASVPVLTQQVRSITLVVDKEDSFMLEQELREFGTRMRYCGSEPHPNAKYFALKPHERRNMRKNKRRGKSANNKVRGLLELINYKRTYDFS